MCLLKLLFCHHLVTCVRCRTLRFFSSSRLAGGPQALLFLLTCVWFFVRAKMVGLHARVLHHGTTPRGVQKVLVLNAGKGINTPVDRRQEADAELGEYYGTSPTMTSAG